MQIGGTAAVPVSVGATIAVVRLASETHALTQVGGELVSLQAQAAAVRLRETVSFAQSEALVLVKGEQGSRAIARATWLQNAGGLAIFRLATAFQPFDARKDPRLPVQLRVEVLSSGSRDAGLMTDISQGGAAVATQTKPAGAAVSVVASHNGFWATLPCRLTGMTPEGSWWILHLQFGEMNVAERAFVRQIIRDAGRALELRAA